MVFSTCASPKITNQHRGTYKFKQEEQNTLLSVSLAKIPNKKTKPKPKEDPNQYFLNLRDSLPHLYMRIMGDKTTHPDSFITYLQRPFLTKETTTTKAPIIDYATTKITLLLAVDKRYAFNESYVHPNTRLGVLETVIELENKDGLFEFYSIDKFTNDIETIDFGTLSRKQSVNLSGELSANASGLSSSEGTSSSNTSNTNTAGNGIARTLYDENGNIEALITDSNEIVLLDQSGATEKGNSSFSLGTQGKVTFTNQESIDEALNLRSKRLRVGYSFRPDSIIVRQQSSPLNDISNNVIMEATVKINKVGGGARSVPTIDFSNLFSKDFAPNPASKLEADLQMVSYFPCSPASAENSVTIKTYYQGLIRRVKNRRRTTNVLEYDDKVEYVHVDGERSDVIVIPSSDFCKNLYAVAAFSNGTQFRLMYKDYRMIDAIEVVDLEGPGLPSFAAWVEEVIDREKQDPLVLNKFELYFQNVTDPTDIRYVVASDKNDIQFSSLKELIVDVIPKTPAKAED